MLVKKWRAKRLMKRNKVKNKITMKFTCDKETYLLFEQLVNQIAESLPSFIKIDLISISKITEECFRLGLSELLKDTTNNTCEPIEHKKALF